MSTETFDYRRLWWLFFAAAGLIYALLGEALYIPDTYEHVILAECFLDGDSPRIDCSEIVKTFRPPLPSIFTLILSPFAHPLYGIVLLSWIATSSLSALFWRFSPSSLSTAQRLSVSLALLSAPLFHVYAQLADARIIVLPFIMLFGLSAWRASEQGPSIPKREALIMGAVVALATLTRPESILLLPLGLAWLLLRNRLAVVWMLPTALTPLVIWWGCLSLSAEQIVFAPRHWESLLLQSTEFMPLRWSKQIFGMGLWSPSLREVSMGLTPTASIPIFSLSEWWAWISSSALSCFSIWVWLGFGLAIVLGLRDTEGRRIILLGGICAFPNLLAAALPQARDPLFQISNLFPLWLVVIIGLGLSIGKVACQSKKLWGLIIILFLGALWRGSEAPPIKNGIEFSDIGRNAINWLSQNTEEGSRVISSFETAPISFLAERKWEQWPSRWGQNRLLKSDGHYLLVSSEDNFWSGSRYGEADLPTPAAYFAIHEMWIMIFYVPEETN